MRNVLAAALLLAAVPAPANAESAPSAVATGLAIPIAGIPDRAPPLPDHGRAILVDAASARLFMIENGQVLDSMRVIVGKPATATPVIRSTIFYATLSPYWNVPADLARTLIAPNVLKHGVGYLHNRGYEVVSRFSANAEVIAPRGVDWRAVADGRATVHVRQRPGPANSMGQVKFGFENKDGIFLHDTPRKALFAEADRSLSNGCVRLEDAPRLARWLMGRDFNSADSTPEQHVPLPGAVPIVITYLDSAAEGRLAALR